MSHRDLLSDDELALLRLGGRGGLRVAGRLDVLVLLELERLLLVLVLLRELVVLLERVADGALADDVAVRERDDEVGQRARHRDVVCLRGRSAIAQQAVVLDVPRAKRSGRG